MPNVANQTVGDLSTSPSGVASAAIPPGAFTITELTAGGGVGAVFEWTTGKVAGTRGGAFACPVKPLSIGGQQRTRRTDYTGNPNPSEQVLGPAMKPQRLAGKWDDRYNFPGYAEAEMRRFEDMGFRGNLVRVQFQNQVFVGLITDWSFDYRKDWDIGYEFTYSVHRRDDRSPRPAPVPRSGGYQQTFDQVWSTTEALLALRRETPVLLDGDLRSGFDVLLENLSASRAAYARMVDQTRASIGAPISLVQTMATQLRGMISDVTSILDELIEVRSDTELAAYSVIDVLNFEDWSRSTRYRSRILLFGLNEGAQELERVAEPDAKAIYRPSAGESLMAISRRFYGDPHAWHLIADRNALQSVILTGDEYLIIPERGTASG